MTGPEAAWRRVLASAARAPPDPAVWRDVLAAGARAGRLGEAGWWLLERLPPEAEIPVELAAALARAGWGVGDPRPAPDFGVLRAADLSPCGAAVALTNHAGEVWLCEGPGYGTRTRLGVPPGPARDRRDRGGVFFAADGAPALRVAGGFTVFDRAAAAWVAVAPRGPAPGRVYPLAGDGGVFAITGRVGRPVGLVRGVDGYRVEPIGPEVEVGAPPDADLGWFAPGERGGVLVTARRGAPGYTLRFLGAAGAARTRRVETDGPLQDLWLSPGAAWVACSLAGDWAAIYRTRPPAAPTEAEARALAPGAGWTAGTLPGDRALVYENPRVTDPITTGSLPAGGRPFLGPDTLLLRGRRGLERLTLSTREISRDIPLPPAALGHQAAAGRYLVASARGFLVLDPVRGEVRSAAGGFGEVTTGLEFVPTGAGAPLRLTGRTPGVNQLTRTFEVATGAPAAAALTTDPARITAAVALVRSGRDPADTPAGRELMEGDFHRAGPFEDLGFGRALLGRLDAPRTTTWVGRDGEGVLDLALPARVDWVSGLAGARTRFAAPEAGDEVWMITRAGVWRVPVDGAAPRRVGGPLAAGCAGGVGALTFEPGGARFAVAAAGRPLLFVARGWRTGELRLTRYELSRPVTALAFSPDGSALACGVGSGVRFVSLAGSRG